MVIRINWVGQLEISWMLKFRSVHSNTRLSIQGHIHTQQWKGKWNEEIRREARASRRAGLTVVASSSAVTSVSTVAVKGVPGLGAFASMFTIVGQTPKWTCRHNYYFSLWDINHLYMFMWKKNVNSYIKSKINMTKGYSVCC